MRMTPQDHPFQRAEPAEYSKCVEVHVTHYGKPVASGFVLLFQENWMIKSSTGSQEVEQLWQTEAIFQHDKTIVRI